MNYVISQIWNFDAKLAVNDSVLSKVNQIENVGKDILFQLG